MHSNTRDRIVSRIQKLLNLAADDAASNGEIQNAMNFATQLIQEHQISQTELEAQQTNTNPFDNLEFIQQAAKGTVAFKCTWENFLGHAIQELVGSVKCYIKGDPMEFQVGAFQKELRRAYMFYGPAEDVQLAIQLFEEWSVTIATIAYGTYKTAYRKEGGDYAIGFATGLSRQAQDAKAKRFLISNTATTALALRNIGNGSLGSILQHKANLAERWFKNSGTKIRKGTAKTIKKNTAYELGLNHGKNVEFTANRQQKLT